MCILVQTSSNVLSRLVRVTVLREGKCFDLERGSQPSMDPEDLSRFCQLPGPSTSSGRGENCPLTDRVEIPFPSYLYGMNAVAGPSNSSVTDAQSFVYPSVSTWPDSQSYSSYMAMAVSASHPPSSYISYPPAPAKQIPPDCLDWTINPVKAPLPQFKTTSEPLFALGYNSTISENWMEGDKGLQYSIKNFTFSTKRMTNNSCANSAGSQIDEYDSLLVSIPQVCKCALNRLVLTQLRTIVLINRLLLLSEQ